MNWFKLAGKMSLDRALQVMGLSPDLLKQDKATALETLKKVYRRLSLLHHPDRDPGGRFIEVNEANEVVQEAIRKGGASNQGYSDYSGRSSNYSRSNSEGISEWETDQRSSYSEVGDDWRNLNRCKKDIYEQSSKNGSVSNYTVTAFDGLFFRSTFTVKTNPQTFGFVGEVMEFWNSHGANSYPTAAVFVNIGQGRIKCIRKNGQDVSSQNIEFEFDSFNSNPGNDQSLQSELRQWVKS